MQSKTPLREKRRLSSRKAFLDAARTLFDNPGFQETTMGQIAELADLHLQTLYSHFPTKQNLAATLQAESFRDALGIRKKDTMTFWREWIRAAAKAQVSKDGGASFFQYLMTEKADPKLAGAQSLIANQYTYSMARAIAEDLNLDIDTDRRPVYIAYMLWGANADAVFRWSKTEGKGDLVKIAVNAVKDVEKIVNEYQQFVGFTDS